MIFCKWSDFSNRLNLLVLTFILFITSGCFLKANISDLSIGTTASIDGGSDKIQLKPSSESLILNETDVDYIDSTSLNLSIDKSFKTDISIQLTLVDIYATQELDYKISPLSIIIPAGATKVNIPIKIIGDSIGEGEETFKILLNLDSQDINLTTTEVLVTIVDNDPITLQVNSLYPVNGTNFFDYVENISTSPLSSIADAVCSYNPSGSNSYDKCLNGGYYRKIQAIGQHSCANLTLSDGLDVFDWKCTDSADPVYFYSSGLKKGKGLKDILNSSSFKNNSVVLKKDGVTVASSNSTTWWSNPVTPIALNPNSGDPRISLTTSGTIYTSTGGNSAGVDISGSRLGFVVISGTLNSINPSTGDCDTGGVGTQQCLVLVKTGSDLSYLEGDFNGTSNLTELVGLEGFIDLFMINNSQLTGQGGSGIEGVGGGGQRFDGTTIAQTKIQNFNFAINSVVGYYKLYYQLEILNNSFGIVESSTSWRSKYVDISLVNNSGFGLVSSSWYVILQNIKAFNNTDYGVGIWGTGSVGKNILSVGNSTKGVDVSNSNSVLSNFTLVSNTTSGLVSSTCLSCLHDNILSSNNGTGIVVYSNAGVYSDIFLTENAKGIDFQSSSSGAEFKNNLFLGNTTNCTYTSIGANPGLTGVDCDNQNLSTATRTLGASALGYFKGKVTSEASNTHSTGVSVANAITDWLNFENFFRVWGNTASAVDLITMNKGACTGSNTCNIWDFGLSSSVSAIRNVHGSVINGATCPTSVQGDKVGLYQGTTPYLINATEIFGDRIGNDNGLCESNEECIFSPNIGAYQGEGDYTTTICQFENGVGSNAIVNVKMYAYPQ